MRWIINNCCCASHLVCLGYHHGISNEKYHFKHCSHIRWSTKLISQVPTYFASSCLLMKLETSCSLFQPMKIAGENLRVWKKKCKSQATVPGQGLLLRLQPSFVHVQALPQHHELPERQKIHSWWRNGKSLSVYELNAFLMSLIMYHTCHMLFSGGLPFFCRLRLNISMSRCLWLPLSVHFDLNSTPNPSIKSRDNIT